MVLFARRGFHAARNVHAKRFHFAHGFGDVFRRQAAGEENWLAEFLRLHRPVPVQFFAREQFAKLGRRLGVSRARALVGPAKNGDAFHISALSHVKPADQSGGRNREF